MKSLAVALIIWGAAACGNGTGPESEFQLNFNVVPADTIMEGDTVIFTRGQLGTLRDSRPVTASAAEGIIRVRGSFVTSCSGPLPVASMERNPDGVALRISFPPSGNHTCASTTQPYIYEARFTRVPVGEYRVLVQHFGDYLRQDGTVLEEQVQVN
jgi:hypothetical protein